MKNINSKKNNSYCAVVKFYRCLAYSLTIVTIVLATMIFTSCNNMLGSDDLDEEEDIAPTYTINYHGNGNTGGSIPTDTNAYEEGDSVTVAENSGNLVKTGYTFVGWNTQADGNGTSYNVNQTFDMGESDVSLFAQWNELTGILTGYVYYASTTIPVSGVTVSVGDVSQTTVSDGAYSLEGLPEGNQQLFATKNGYDDYTASVEVSGTYNIEITGGEVFNLTGNVSFEEDSIQGVQVVVLNPDGSDSMLRDHTDSTGNYQLPTVPQGERQVAFRHNDYRDEIYTIFIASADRNYNAVLEKTHVFYFGNGNTGGQVPVDNQHYNEEEEAVILDVGNLVFINEFEISLVFVGWNTNEGGTGKEYQPGDAVVMTRDDLELHAQWTVIGGIGPAGGIVFYDHVAETAELHENGWQYLEAWTEDEFSSRWKVERTNTVGTSTAIGTGYSNTYDAMYHYTGNHPAAVAAYEATHGGFEDWFLPSKDELNLMYEQSEVIGYFDSITYWSSSQYNDSHAWYQYLEDPQWASPHSAGYQGTIEKDLDGGVRVIRAF